MNFICEHCGKELVFKKKGNKRKFCSNKCRNRHFYVTDKYGYFNRHKINLNKICPICGKHFIAKNIRKICCYGESKHERSCYYKYKLIEENKKCQNNT